MYVMYLRVCYNEMNIYFYRLKVEIILKMTYWYECVKGF